MIYNGFDNNTTDFEKKVSKKQLFVIKTYFFYFNIVT